MPTAQNRLVVLDAWPVIEHYEGNDPASAQLTALLAQRRPRPVMSAATFTEVQYALANRHGSDAAEHEAGDLLHLVRVEPLDALTATTAARIKHAYRMSLGDAFAAATAIRHRTELWTGDPELLCPDRVWEVLDLRSADLATPAPPGRRPDALRHLDHGELATYVSSSLAQSQPR